METKIIFDNGGGVTLQCSDDQGKLVYCKYHDDMKLAGQDLGGLIDGDDPAEWDGHEPDQRVTDEQIEKYRDSGGYRVFNLLGFVNHAGRIAAGEIDNWKNIAELAEEVHVPGLADGEDLEDETTSELFSDGTL